MKVFFDTSSFVKRFVQEAGSKQADDITLKASEIGLSIICFPEIISALRDEAFIKIPISLAFLSVLFAATLVT